MENITFDSFAENCQNTIETTGKFLEDTISNPEKRFRQAAAVSDGIIVGGIKAIPDRIINHPVETAGSALAGIAIGGAFGVAMAAESPLIAAGVAVGATALTCSYVYDLGSRLANDNNLGKALDNIWDSGSAKTLDTNLPVIENKLGKESFEFGIATLSGSAGYRGGTRLVAGLSKFVPENLTLGWYQVEPRPQPAYATKPGSTVKSVEMQNVESKQSNTFAMEGFEWHRDRMGGERFKRPDGYFRKEVESTTLSKRLDKLEEFIQKDELGEAFDFAEENLSFHGDHRGPYDNVHGKLEKQFLYVNMCLWSALYEGNAPKKAQALELISNIRKDFAKQSDWPLSVSSDKAGTKDHVLNISDKQRVKEIELLMEHEIYDTACDTANWSYIFHRDARHPKFGTPKPINVILENKFDMLHYDLARYKLGYDSKENLLESAKFRLKDLKDYLEM